MEFRVRYPNSWKRRENIDNSMRVIEIDIIHRNIVTRKICRTEVHAVLQSNIVMCSVSFPDTTGFLTSKFTPHGVFNIEILQSSLRRGYRTIKCQNSKKERALSLLNITGALLTVFQFSNGQHVTYIYYKTLKALILNRNCNIRIIFTLF